MADKNKSGAPDGEEKPSGESSKPKSYIKKIRPDLIVSEVRRGVRFGDTYIRTQQSHQHYFRKVGPGHFVAEEDSHRPAGLFAKAYRIFKKFMLGRPLETAEEIHQRLNKFKALAVFGSDAISSSAYATEAALVILMAAGNGALHISFYTAIATVILLAIVAFSYRQTVYAYPNGGGSYIVSRENLGVAPGLIAAAALMIDYILTVAVSIGAGAWAVTSAIHASGHSVPPHLDIALSLIFIAIMVLVNLRGIRESGTIFAIPTYLFIIGLSVLLVIGLVKVFSGTLQPASTLPIVPVPPQVAQPLTLWLILRAFSAGAVAMSGTEAISNGVTAFQKPESKNASRTLITMAAFLGVFFLGVSYLAMHLKLVPGNETIISQVARSVFGGTNALYMIFQVATMGILIIAANTAFAGFPRLASIMARDGYMPHQFTDRGDRLAFSTGIIALGGIAALLIVIFEGNVNKLIHLYAVGVFLAFCLSNSGMVVHWWKKRGLKWKSSIVINGIGAVVTASILIICVVTKFMFGAWIVVLLVPLLAAMFFMIHRHYVDVSKQLTIVTEQLPSPKLDQLVIVPIEDVDYASLRAISFARTISADAIILHVSTNPESAAVVKRGINTYAPDLKLIVVESPYRSMVQPLLSYVNAVHSQRPDAFVTIVLPRFITAHWWEKYLHEHTALRLRKACEKHPNIAVVVVPYLLEK